MPKSKKIAALILAGGKSERMGFPKPWLKYSIQETFASQLISTFRYGGITDIYLVLNQEFISADWKDEIHQLNDKCHLVVNPNPELGRLNSIKLGLEKIGEVDYVFIHNVDCPQISPNTIEQLKQNLDNKKYTIPKFLGKSGHPVLLSKIIVETIKNLDNREQDLRIVLQEFEHGSIEVSDKMVLENINTPEEYKHSFGRDI